MRSSLLVHFFPALPPSVVQLSISQVSEVGAEGQLLETKRICQQTETIKLN